MTVYNEADFIEPAIRACLPFVDHLVIVEGAYQETIKLGASPRSTDGTLKIIDKICDELAEGDDDSGTIIHVSENKETDKNQRNAGLEIVKAVNPDGWLLIIDGDEVYTKETLNMIKVATRTMDVQKRLAAYFKSMTFVNDLRHYTEQEFPRLFKITPECTFVNDNFMVWPDKGVDSWISPFVMKIPYIKYHHYAFCKSHERFKLKKEWWESRFKNDFEYSWHIDEKGKIVDPDHQIMLYTGQHPKEMENHSLWKESYENI